MWLNYIADKRDIPNLNIVNLLINGVEIDIEDYDHKYIVEQLLQKTDLVRNKTKYDLAHLVDRYNNGENSEFDIELVKRALKIDLSKFNDLDLVDAVDNNLDIMGLVDKYRQDALFEDMTVIIFKFANYVVEYSKCFDRVSNKKKEYLILTYRLKDFWY